MASVILVHGGAGEIKSNTVAEKLIQGVKRAAVKGYETLKSTGNIVHAVEAAVKIMESEEEFNAGLGSVLNMEGEVEMDASIMVGADLSAGAVTVVKDIEHPISLARLVMEKTSHVLLAADGAVKFAQQHGVPVLPPGSLVTEKSKDRLENTKKKLEQSQVFQVGDTVGAVIVDAHGRVAAATSTGGRDEKLVGRSSDTCVIGGGTYADDNIGAVSTTGHGETIMKFCLAHAIVKAMENGKSAQEATHYCIKTMTERLQNTAGAITVSNNGDVGIAFSTNRMSWAYIKGDEIHFGIDQDEHNIEKLSENITVI